jgi:hypothetical protein
MIALADTCSHPSAMVIVAFYTDIAIRAVYSIWRLIDTGKTTSEIHAIKYTIKRSSPKIGLVLYSTHLQKSHHLQLDKSTVSG